MSRFELPAPRPPDAYSNLTELHPDDGMGVGVGVGVRQYVISSEGIWSEISGANLINSDGSTS